MVGIALVLAIGACDGGPSPNVDELDGSKIAFVSDRDSNNPDTMGNIEIYVMNADGSGQTRLTSGSAINCCPSWSPDGTKIAFSYSPGFVINNLMAPYKIDTMNADGSDRARLTINPEDKHPSWSPDGTKLALSSVRDDDVSRSVEIYVMNADGSNRTRLTNNWYNDWHPSWSSDGTKIAFSSARDGTREIYVMDADGSGQTNLTNNPGWDQAPSWSPDATKIAFSSARDGNHDIYVMNADGSNRTRLTDNSAIDLNPSWSPDGSMIAFSSDRDGKMGRWTVPNEIYVMNADGSNQTRLTNNPADDTEPSWSPRRSNTKSR